MSTVPPIPMFAPDGSLKMVPNHLIDAATKSGGQAAVAIIAPDGSKKYAPQGQVRQLIMMGAKMAPVDQGKSTTENAQDISGIHPFQNPIAQTAAGLGRVALGVAEAPYNIAKAAISPKQTFQSAVVDPAKKAVGQAKQFSASGHPILAGLSALGAIPVLGSMGQNAGERMAAGDIPGAVTESAANSVLMGAPGAVTKAAGRVVSPALRRGAEIVSDTGPKTTKELVAKTKAVNDAEVSRVDESNAKATAKAAEDTKQAEAKHLEDTQSALHETRGREIAHEQAVKSKAHEIEESDAKEAADVDAHNARITDKHAAVSKRITEENAAQDNLLQMRQQHVENLDAETKKYYAQEDAAKAKAKSEENAAWQPWRSKMKDAMIDGGEIAARLKPIAKGSPEVTRVLRQLQPSAADATPDSLYAQDRAAIMKSQGYTGNYFDYPDNVRGQIDSIAASSGFEPEPIDFDPQAGRPIPVDQIHRAQSIIDNSIRSGRFEGPLLGEMKQVAKALRAAVTKSSAERGAIDDLQSAREATRRYQNAFGRERHLPQTQDEIREKQANPEAYKERSDEERLGKAAQYDPSLVESYRRVKDARAELRKLPSDEQLRKARKQVPAPPTVDDLREGYRLKAKPKQATGSPEERARQEIAAPERIPIQDRPSPVVPKLNRPNIRQVGADDVRGAKTEALTKRAQQIQHYANRAAMYVTTYRTLAALGRAATGDAGALAGIPADIGEGIAVSGGGHLIAKVLQNPRVMKLLTEPKAADIASIPPEMRGDLSSIVQTAQRQGIKVSPILLRALAVSQPRHPVFSAASPVQ